MAETSRDTWQRRLWRVYPVCLTLLVLGLLVSYGGLLLAGPDITKDTFFIQSVSKMLIQLGSVIGIGAVLTVVSDALLQHRVFQQFSEEVSRKVGDLVFKDLKGLRALGVERVTRRIKFNELFGGLKSGDRVYILITFLSAFDECLASAEAAAMKDVDLFFLIMSPESTLLEMRAKEIDYTVRVFSNGIENFVDSVDKMKERLRRTRRDTKVHLVLYKDLIGSPIFLVKSGDNPQVAYSSFYFDTPFDSGLAYFEWSNKGADSFIHTIDRYILGKWERNAPANEVAVKPQAY
jgi:hypothetical protein